MKSQELTDLQRAGLAIKTLQTRLKELEERSREPIAVVGLGCRLPGGIEDPAALWSLLERGGDAVTEVPAWRWDREALYDPTPGRPGKMYTLEAGWLDGFERFDAFFFGISPREAASIDPQQRLLLETCWTALEAAGEKVDRLAGAPVGMFLAVTSADYAVQTIQAGRPELLNGSFVSGSSLNGGAGRVAYTFGFTGPCLTIDTACSSSLVALHLAVRSLRARECSMALAAGINLTLYAGTTSSMCEGRMLSPTGRCRTFDAAADGSVRGEGCAAVVLKRLSDALRDGNPIHAVIRGTAINQDGASSSLSTPNGLAQEAVFRAALLDAGLTPADIDYVETHGSATPIGDPIEVRSLSAVYGAARPPGDPLWIGSVKTNLGHLESAAGMAGLLKVVLSLEQRWLPPHLHFEDPNPEIEWQSCGVRVCAEGRSWQHPAGPRSAMPRRGAVSGFGVSGTNAHVIVEEAPEPQPSGSSRSHHALVLSAPTPSGLDALTRRLVDHLERHPEQPFADVVYTLQTGRASFPHRRVAVCSGREDAIAVLRSMDAARVVTRQVEAGRKRPVVFMFPGTGEHYPGMARGLYEQEPVFREEIDRCAQLLRPELGCDLIELLYGAETAPGTSAPAVNFAAVDFAAMVRGEKTAGPLSRTLYAHTALVAVEYALGRLLMAWGVEPKLMIGYSTGEYVAACLAGVLSLEDMLRVIARRARLIERQPRGAMLSVLLGVDEVRRYLGDGVWLAAANSPQLCVVAGTEERVAACAERLRADGVVCRAVPVEHAFHTPSIAGIETGLLEALAGVELKPPQIPVISNVTGERLTAELACDPRYWYRHAVSPVRFAEGLATVWQRPERILLEVGPGLSLSSFAQQLGETAGGLALGTMPGRFEHPDDVGHLQAALGKLWLGGMAMDWHGLYARERRRKVSLPTYPFERQRYWIETAPQTLAPSAPASSAGAEKALEKEPIERWFHLPEWRRRRCPAAGAGAGGKRREGCWIVLGEGHGLAAALDERLQAMGERVVHVTAGSELAVGGGDRIVIDPSNPEHYRLLAHDLRAKGTVVKNVVHLWAAEPLAGGSIAAQTEAGLERGFYSLLWLLQALDENALAEGMAVVAVTAGAQSVLGDDLTVPARTAVEGLLRVVPQEVAGLRACALDLPDGELDAVSRRRWAGMILSELEAGLPEPSVALRGTTRWVRELVPIELSAAAPSALPLRRGGVYLITGGLGGLGRALAAHLAERWAAKLVLLGRRAPPAPETWDEILAQTAEDDPEREQVCLLKSLAERGIESVVVTADVADREALAAGIAAARAQLGRIEGIFHCAGTPGSGLILTKRREACAAVFAPKIAGTLNLAEVCAEDAPDLVVYFSSVAALQGPLGQSDYAAANAFLDGWAHWQRARGVPAIAVNWGIWRECRWQEKLTAVLPAAQQLLRDRRDRLGIELDEGMDALGRVIALGAPQVVVSSMLLEHQQLDAVSFRDALAQPLSQRPAGLLSEYVAPRLDSERVLVEIWGEVLGIDGIGVVDDFFELGGHSLVGTRIMSEASRRFGVALSLRALFAAPTIEKLAMVVEEQIVAELESMAELGDHDLVETGS